MVVAPVRRVIESISVRRRARRRASRLERLVHQEDRWAPDHRSSHGNALAFPAGELTWGSLEQVVDAQGLGH